MVSVGGRKEGMTDLATAAQAGNSESELQAETAENTPVRQTEGEYLWSWDTSSLYKVDTLGNGGNYAQTASLALTPTVPSAARRTMPRRVRIALIIFLIVGVLALTTDGFLLALSIIRHHTQSSPPTMARTATGGNTRQLLLTPVAQVSTTPTTNALENAFTLSSSHLFFVSTQGQSDSAPQTVVLTSNQPGGFDWQVVSGLPTWLHLSSTQGSATAGARAELIVSVQATQLAPETYTDRVEVKATDSQGNALPQGLQEIDITLNVLAPCVLKVTPTKMSFKSTLLQPAPSSQTLSLTESGGCTRPINWQISSDMSWVTFSSTGGSDNGSGSTISVQANNPNKLVGTYTATLTLQAFDSTNTPLSGSPTTIAVTLAVTVV